MNDLISRREVTAILDKYRVPDSVYHEINKLPEFSADREKGEWEYTGDYLTEGMLKCSKCGKEVDVSEWDFHFCPNCGRIMRGDKAE